MTQLLRVRHLEEEQSRLQLESALAEELGLDRALQLASGRNLALRIDVQKAMLSVQCNARARAAGQADELMLQRRAAELESERNAQAIAKLEEQLREARLQSEDLRAAFFAARLRRMQVETVLTEEAAAEALVAGRRHQSALDDWFGSRAAQNKNHVRVV